MFYADPILRRRRRGLGRHALTFAVSPLRI